ncbi:MAG: TonB-dependent receptor [Bacteroidales bacterium]|nr:TonB-dependent receptor [Bacteroidales bacterium]
MKRLLMSGLLALAICVCQGAMAQDTLKKYDLQELVVTGTGTLHILKDAPVQTEVITRSQLKNFSGSSLQDILAGLATSFDFNEDDMGSHITMNGLGNSYILILVDGKRLNGDIGGDNDLHLIDPQNIEKIEIVKGASSALYGSDAIAGVINIITRKHDDGLFLENSTKVGSYGDIRQHNGIGIRSGRWNSYTNFQMQHTDGWQNTSVEYTLPIEEPILDSRNKTRNRFTNWQVAQRLTYDAGRSGEYYAEGSIYGKRIFRPKGKYAHYDVNTYDLAYQNASASLGGKWTLGGKDYITFDADWNRHAYYYHFTDVTLVEDYEKSAGTKYYPYYPYLAGQEALQSDQQRTLISAKGVFSLPYNNRVSGGAEFRYDYLNAPNRVEGKTVDDWTAAVYVQDEFNPVKSFNITAGLRLTDNHQFGFKATPKLSIMWSVTDDLRFRASWSQGFKTPVPKELYYMYVKQMTGTYLYLGNRDLKPQSSNYYSASLEYTLGGLVLTASGYFNKLDNMITLVTIPIYEAPADLVTRFDPVKVRQYQNMDKAKTFGGDFSLRWKIGEFLLNAGYSYLQTKADQYDADHETLRRVKIDGMAHHKGSFSLLWSHSFSKAYQMSAGIYGRMSSKRYYQTDGDGKGYQLWRLSTTHDFVRSRLLTFSFQAGIDNIFNYIDKTPHGRHLGTTSPGRTFYAGIVVRFTNGRKTINKIKTNLNQNEDEN